MLQKLLRELLAGQVRTQAGLASVLGVSEGLLAQMLDDLTRKGYLGATSDDCAGESCRSCPFGKGCVTKQRIRSWWLTEKGRRAATRAIID